MSLPFTHTFVILAYKESPYLEDCILSLKKQTMKSKIILSTSTPSRFLNQMSQKHAIPLVINSKKQGIASDWSFAYQHAETDFVTLAHQDDVYQPTYTESCLNTPGVMKSIILFTDYIEEHEGRIRETNLLLKVKRMMLTFFFPFQSKLNSLAMKKLLISLGNPISCPTVMYNKGKIGKFDFNQKFVMNLDWEANFRFAEMPGDFIYINNTLVIRKIHKDSETTKTLQNHRRHEEDRLIFESIWPDPIVKILLKLYSTGYKSNE